MIQEQFSVISISTDCTGVGTKCTNLIGNSSFANQLAVYSKRDQEVDRKGEGEPPNLFGKERFGRTVYKSRSSPVPIKNTKLMVNTLP